MSIILIPENVRDSRHCPFDGMNPCAGTRCPHALEGYGTPCNSCGYATHDAHHLSFIAIRLREIPEQIDALAKEAKSWPTTRSRSAIRGQIKYLLAEFQELSELMKRLELRPDIPGVVPSIVGYHSLEKK